MKGVKNTCLGDGAQCAPGGGDQPREQGVVRTALGGERPRLYGRKTAGFSESRNSNDARLIRQRQVLGDGGALGRRRGCYARNYAAPGSPECFRHLRQLRGYGLGDQLRAGQQGFQLSDVRGELVPFRFQLQPRKLREPAKTEFENVLRLFLGEVEDAFQGCLGSSRVVGSADDLNDLVDIGDGHQQALDQVQAASALNQTKFRPSRDDSDAVIQINLKEVFEPQRPRLTIDQGDRVDGEAFLEWGEAIELRQHGGGIETRLNSNHQAQPVVAIGEIGHIADAGELFAVDSVFNLVDDALGTDQIGELGDHQTGFPRPDVFDADTCPRFEATSAGFVGVRDPVRAHDGAATGQIGTRNKLLQVLGGGIGVLEEVTSRGDDFTQVVRRHVGGHTHSDTACSVDQQMGNCRGKNTRLG